MKNQSILIIVGDVSADRHVAPIIKEIRLSLPDLSIWGVGGSEMQEEGVEVLYHLKNFNTFGIVEVLKFIPLLAKIRKQLLAELLIRKPSMVLLVDYGGFNLRMAKDIRKIAPDLPIFHFISPQVWASRPWRIKTIARNISKMLVIFPFEESLYRSKRVNARFVGHPLVETLPDAESLRDRKYFAEKFGLNESHPIVAVLPGSRKEEIRVHMDILCQAILEIWKERPEVQFVVSKATNELSSLIDEKLLSLKTSQGRIFSSLDQEIPQIHGICGIDSLDNHILLANADLVWAKSGTTTLEVAMFEKPMLIFYRGNWLSFFLFMIFKTVKNVGWPNLLAGYQLVPELLQLDFRAEKLKEYTLDLLDVPGLRQEIAKELRGMRKQLGEGNYKKTVSEEILNNFLLPNIGIR